jgi:sterol desaturase/sphingolipid hydroxylase (fatty acid hydroxylase superfamily)
MHNSLLRYLTPCIDYAVLFMGLSTMQAVFDTCHADPQCLQTRPLRELVSLLGLAIIVMNIVWFCRERAFFWLMGKDVSIFKRQYRLCLDDLYHVVRTSCVTTCGIGVMIRYDLVYFFPTDTMLRLPTMEPGMDWSTTILDVLYYQPSFVSAYITTITAFYLLLLMKDFFVMNLLHRLLHYMPLYHIFHITHHEVSRNSQFHLAFHSNPIDILLESVGPPFFLWGLLSFAGFPIYRVPISTIHLMALFEGGIHSINPYTILFWNPVVDRHLNANIMHTIHHVTINKYYTTVPLHHLVKGGYIDDARTYDRIMHTTLFN